MNHETRRHASRLDLVGLVDDVVPLDGAQVDLRDRGRPAKVRLHTQNNGGPYVTGQAIKKRTYRCAYLLSFISFMRIWPWSHSRNQKYWWLTHFRGFDNGGLEVDGTDHICVHGLTHSLTHR